MSARKLLVYLLVCVGVPAAAAAGWWFYWPHYRLGQAERAAAAGDWARVDELVRPLLAAEPSPPRALLLGGQALRRLNRPDEAEPLLVRAGRLGADERAVRRELALARAAQRFTSVAERALAQCLMENADDAEVLAALARGCAEGGRWEQADAYFTRALALRPDDTDLWFARGHLRLTAASEYHQGRAANAAADFREVLRRDPDSFDARLYLAHCLVADARMAEARALLRDCRRQAPDRVEPLVGLASCALEENDWDEAERLLRTAAERDPRSVYVLTMQGDLALRRERCEEAVGFFRKVLAVDRGNAPARLKLAQALRALNRTAEAEAELREYERLKAGSAGGRPPAGPEAGAPGPAK